jgi:hypothetical protein
MVAKMPGGEILKTVPALSVPLVDVVPCRFPSAPRTRLAKGAAPLEERPRRPRFAAASC